MFSNCELRVTFRGYLLAPPWLLCRIAELKNCLFGVSYHRCIYSRPQTFCTRDVKQMFLGSRTRSFCQFRRTTWTLLLVVSLLLLQESGTLFLWTVELLHLLTHLRPGLRHFSLLRHNAHCSTRLCTMARYKCIDWLIDWLVLVLVNSCCCLCRILGVCHCHAGNTQRLRTMSVVVVVAVVVVVVVVLVVSWHQIL